MICRTCLRQAAGFTTRQLAPNKPLVRTTAAAAAAARSFSTTLTTRNAAAAAASSTAPAAEPSAQSPSTPNLTPLTPAAAEGGNQAAKPLSSCPAGTVLTGLNYFKGKTDPVALPDEEYPAWLWKCLEVQKKADAGAEADAGDEFSKSKKQRRLALKRQRQHEARLLASGDLEALAPKVPLHKQSINLSGGGDGGGKGPGDLSEALAAADKREELRRAMRKERRAKIKESNYLKSM